MRARSAREQNERDVRGDTTGVRSARGQKNNCVRTEERETFAQGHDESEICVRAKQNLRESRRRRVREDTTRARSAREQNERDVRGGTTGVRSARGQNNCVRFARG